ncbi:MAG TPA: efflux RND transporter periplasmic adaptor subunit [Longimicrobiales bacterium]|nr:efflux RND transporter periplasmic adaptor subunit [Longimicrobiales bacterium]
MKKPTRRQTILIATGAVIFVAIIWAFMPDPMPVDVAEVTRGPLQVIVEEEGETRVEDRYVVTSPVAAYARRIELEEGDIVQQGDVLVQLEPPRATALDPRTRAQAEARVRAAAAAVEDAAVVVQRTAADRERMETLYDAGAITQVEVEEARAAAVRATAALEAAQAELQAARAAASDGGATGSAGVPDVLRAPAGGRVLTIHHRSEGHVNPGEPLLEVGDTRGIEITADVLSQDAVEIRPGTPVVIDQWGGDTTLNAVVTRVEPQGFTEVSALGVEEQRVPVRARITSPPGMWAGLGSGYRVLARFVVWQGDNVLQVPTSALFRSTTGDGWAVFVFDDGRARYRDVQAGQQAGLAAQVLDGLQASEEVIVHPPNELEDGMRVSRRTVIEPE